MFLTNITITESIIIDSIRELSSNSDAGPDGIPCSRLLKGGEWLSTLNTDDMQFGFKNNNSTVLCTAVYIETINHYMNEGSDVYSCLIDASKAFDRVYWGKLF